MDTLYRTTRQLFARVLVSAILLAPLAAYSQINTYVRAIRSSQGREAAPLRISAELAKSTELARVVLYYRQFGQSEFRVLEMPITGDTASVTISEGEVTPPFMEVYVLAQTLSGQNETYPFENPMATPTRIPVAAKSSKDQEVLILSPDATDRLIPADIYISISFVYASDQIDRKKTKIFFDNVDVSALAVSLGELTIVSPDALPKNIAVGSHKLRIDVYDTTNAPYHSVERTMSVVTEQQAEAIREQVQYSANAQAEGRNEDIKGTTTQYKRLNARANASYGILKTTGNIQLTSEEQSDRQPQNRYFFGLDAKYLRVGIGDAYPRFPSAVMDGRRVRGVTADLLLGPFNVNYANGEIVRRVDSDTIIQKVNDTLTTRTFRAPIFKRNLTVLRPSFGKGENFQIGLTYLKSVDEYTKGTIDSTTKPQENVVLGTDAVIAFDDHRFEITAQTSLSLNNIDVSAPEFTKDRIDTAVFKDSTLSKPDGDAIKKYLPYISKFILWNENLQPLNPIGLTSLVYETGLAFNYFGNYLKASYIYHGADYISVGTTSLRRDVKGFNVFDRMRLFQNRVFLTGSYEQLQNNTSGRDTILTTAGLVRVTTTYQTINTSLSYYPSTNMPNITLGYGINKNSNPVNPSDTIARAAARAIDENTNRYFLQSTYDFAYRGRHNATLSVDVSNKKDNTPREQHVKSLNAFLLLNTVHTFPLETSFGYSMSLNTIPQASVDTAGHLVTKSVPLNYTTITLNGRYKIYKDVLKLSATIAPTFGDFKRTVLEAGLQYAITQNQNAALQYQYIINTPPPPGTTQISDNDSYVSLIYRIDF